MTPELAPPLLTTTPHQREDVSALDRFNVHRCPTRRVFSGTGLEPVTKQATVRYLYQSTTAATIIGLHFQSPKNGFRSWKSHFVTLQWHALLRLEFGPLEPYQKLSKLLNRLNDFAETSYSSKQSGH
ncbi:uncharacterized protein TNCV_50981 [Trichonephila clavipes]|nr:uncharacterized protein TNCV_50981 [Trichonephila clavipes]